jgi:sporadic carbohydrate cluster protein (TIGR04323 family)
MLLQNWENQTLEYDLDRYPWPKWVLEVIQEIEPAVQDLSQFHTVVPTEGISRVTSHVQNAFSRQIFMERFDAFAAQYLAPLANNCKYMLKRQATLNLVVPNQVVTGRLLPFHQGVWYNNGRGQGTVWMALTNCYDSNSVWVVDTEQSRKISKDTIKNQWNQNEFEAACLKSAYPVNIKPGQCHLFHQEIIHGNINNVTDITRMSIDWHILHQGHESGRRLPGGFFRFPGDYSQAKKSQQQSNFGFITYLGNNTEYDQGIPAVMQRTMIDQYCSSFGLATNGMQFENEYLTWMPVLEHLINQKVPGIVMLSIFSLPDDRSRRQELLKLALENNIEIHFANEYIKMTSQDDADLIERYRSFSIFKDGPYSWEE